MEAFGKFFRKDVRVYLYPYKDQATHEVWNAENLKVSDNLKELYKYFKHNNRIVDIKNYNPAYSEIYSRDILKKIANCEGGWESQLPEGVAELIKDRRMFGYKDEVTLDEIK